MGKDPRAHLVVITTELFLPWSDSLKAKRRIILAIQQRIRGRLNAAVAEIGHHDEWQRCVLGIAMWGMDNRVLQRQIDIVTRLIAEHEEIELGRFDTEWL